MNKSTLHLPCWLIAGLFALSVGVSNEIIAGQLPPDTDIPERMPRETGRPGDKYVDAIKQFTRVDAGGELSFALPLYEVPGRIPVPITLTYSSGIALDQMASEVGLGWNMAQWSVRRITVHGDDQTTRTSVGEPYDGEQNSRYLVNDAFRVSVPGRTMLFFNVGSMNEPVFIPGSYSTDSLSVEASDEIENIGPTPHCGTTRFEWTKYSSFVLTDQDGQRYVFGQALERTCTNGPLDHLFPDQALTQSGLGEWVLTAILSHDYIDGGGDTLNPLDCQSPRTDNKGSWVAFVYTDNDLNEFSVERVEMNSWCGSQSDCDPPLHLDFQETAFLHKIITPGHVVQFEAAQLYRYRTMRFQRSGDNDNVREANLIVASIRAFEYSGDSTLPTGPELYGVTFNYEGVEWSDQSPNLDTIGLKKGLHERVANLVGSVLDLTMHGEPTLRSITIGTDVEYAISEAKQAKPFHGKKVFSFEYDQTFDTSFVFYNWPTDTEDGGLIRDHGRWKEGRALNQVSQLLDSLIPLQDCINDQSCMEDEPWNIVDSVFAGRDHFGYHYQRPWAWSLTKIVTPYGVQIAYEYEQDTCVIDGDVYAGGGCRVSRVIINGNVDEYSPDRFDQFDADSILFIYGENGDGKGYPTNKPNPYWSLWTAGTGSIYDRRYSDQYEFFLGSHVSAKVQYPEIKMMLPGNRGCVKRFFITTDSIPGNVRHQMRMGLFEYPDEPPYPDTIGFNVYYSVWHDRSPMLGLEYKTVFEDYLGEAQRSSIRHYSWEPVNAQTFVIDTTIGCQCYGPPPSTSCDFDLSTSFPAGDTVFASYAVRLDKNEYMQDGVTWTDTNTYDDLNRIVRHSRRAHGKEWVREYQYASDVIPAMRDRHYLSALRSVTEREQEGVNDSVMSESIYRYRSDFPSQNQSGSETIWYQAGDSVYSSYHDGYLVSSVGDVDDYGNVIRWSDQLGTEYSAFVDIKSNTTTFAGVSDDGWAAFTAEADLQDHYVNWSWGVNGSQDSSISFTGRKCARIEALPDSWAFGPTVDFPPTLSGTHVADCWVYNESPSQTTLVMTTQDGGTVEYEYCTDTVGGSWQHLVCSVTVELSDTLIVYLKSYDSEAFVDEIRIYPAAALVSSQIIDPIGRIGSESDYSNVPLRTYYFGDGSVQISADHDNSTLAGSEVMWRRDLNHGELEPEYSAIEPNQVVEFIGNGAGLVEDFRNNPLPRWQVTGPGALDYDVENQRLYFETSTPSSDYVDIVIPVESFTNGFVAMDTWHNWTMSGMARTMDDVFECTPVADYTNLWFGFESSLGVGYAASFAYAYGIEVFSYDGVGYSNSSTIDEAYSGNWVGMESAKVQRLMFGKIGQEFFVFLNGDCIHHFSDDTYSAFDRLKLRIKHSGIQTEGDESFWLDNLVFYSDPSVATTFLDAFGREKQVQSIIDGRIAVQGKRIDLGGQELADFLPVHLDMNPDYIVNVGAPPACENIAQAENHRSPFDFIEKYLNHDEIFTWVPGDAFPQNSYLYTYYNDTSGTADCWDDQDFVPFRELRYEEEPARRLSQSFWGGPHRDYPKTFDYGASEGSIGYIDASYGADSLFKDKIIDEAGNSVVSFSDKLNRLVATVGDSTAAGYASTTYFYKDYFGNDTLVVRPKGDVVRSVYANLGWLLASSSPDFEVTDFHYDSLGNARLFQDGNLRELDTTVVDSTYITAISALCQTAGCADTAIRIVDAATVVHNYPSISNSDGLPGNRIVIKVNQEVEYTLTCTGQCYDTASIAVESGDTVYLIAETDPADTGAISAGVSGWFYEKTETPLETWLFTDYDPHHRPVADGTIQGETTLTGQICTITDTADVSVKRRLFYDQNNSSNSAGRLSLSWADWPGHVDYAEKWDYDDRGRVVSRSNVFEAHLDSTDGQYTVSGFPLIVEYSYDNADRLRTLTYPDTMVVTYWYNDLGLLSSVGDLTDSTRYCTIRYWPDGSRKQLILGDNVQVVDYGYNTRGWLTSINKDTATHSGPNDVFVERLFYLGDTLGVDGPQWSEVGANGNIVTQVVDVGPIPRSVYYFDYDGLSRLDSVWQRIDGQPSGSILETFEYDLNGNFISQTRQGQVANYEYASGTNQLDSVSSFACRSYSHDPNGNVTFEHVKNTDFTYSAFGQLTSVHWEGGAADSTIEYSYNASGERIAKIYRYKYWENCGWPPLNLLFGDWEPPPPRGDSCLETRGSSVFYALSEGKVLAEYPVYEFYGESPGRKYIYAGNDRIAMIDETGKVYFYLNDHLGSARILIDESGVIYDRHMYYAYGANHAQGVATNQPHRYTGKPLDDEHDLNIYYYGARYYDPEVGRFLAIDPFHLAFAHFSPYVYGNACPTVYTDPTGEGPVAKALKVARRVLSKRLVSNARKTAVRRAWAQERRRLKETGETMLDLTESEKMELLKKGRVKGWEGHHINSVNANDLEMAMDPNNIKFVKGRSAHLREHGGNWNTETSGDLIDRLSRLSGPALLAFFIQYDRKMRELLSDCPGCSDPDSWHAWINPMNASIETIAYAYALAAAYDTEVALGDDYEDSQDSELDEIDPERERPTR